MFGTILFYLGFRENRGAIEKLWFEVEKGNRQMEMFTNCYCKPIMTFDFFKCQLIIKQKGGQDNGLDAGET